MVVPNILNNRKINALYLITFFLNVHAALPAYVNSSYITEFASDKIVGVIYTIAAIFSIFVFIMMPKILRTFGNYRVAIFFISVEIFSMIFLGFAPNVWVAVIFLISSINLIRVIGFNDDVFLENLSIDEETGGTRGFFLVATNFAWVISPLIAGFILGDAFPQYHRLYLVSALFLIPLLVIVAGKFKDFKDPVYSNFTFKQSFEFLKKRKNIYRIIVSNTILRLFFAWMVIYTPIYLHQHIGFEWSEIGIIFTIMLLPYVFLEFPLGWLADNKFGEKEMLSIGFVIIAISTIAISFINSEEIWIWALVLLMTRVGASFVESMNEIYFFKKIDGTDSNLIGFFRVTHPIAYIIGPLIATFILFFIDIKYSFLVLAGIVLWGLRYSLTIKDTR